MDKQRVGKLQNSLQSVFPMNSHYQSTLPIVPQFTQTFHSNSHNYHTTRNINNHFNQQQQHLQLQKRLQDELIICASTLPPPLTKISPYNWPTPYKRSSNNATGTTTSRSKVSKSQNLHGFYEHNILSSCPGSCCASQMDLSSVPTRSRSRRTKILVSFSVLLLLLLIIAVASISPLVYWMALSDIPPITASNPQDFNGTDTEQLLSPKLSSNDNEDDSGGFKVFWSSWSEWSPCRGANSECDPGRIHSRIRKCLSESGEVVSSDYCRMSSGEQQELEIRACRCGEDNNKMKPKHSGDYESSEANSTLITELVSHTANIEQHRPCQNCQENEICLLQVKAAVPFCARVKDPRDPRGCGGWCADYKELCRYVGAGTYQCVDDSECLEGEWQCANGLCIPESRRCDGHFNCFDMSDESNCVCDLRTEFQCGNKTSCLHLSMKCNGHVDCWDESDEANCSVCPSEQYTCNSGQCISKDYFCDRLQDCDDGSDEPTGCSSPCPPSQHQCPNGRCVSDMKNCDYAISNNHNKTNLHLFGTKYYH